MLFRSEPSAYFPTESKSVRKLRIIIIVLMLMILAAVIITFTIHSVNDQRYHSFDYQYNKATACAAEDDYSSAISYLERALAIQPKNLDVRLLLAEYNEKNGQQQETITLLEEILNMASKNRKVELQGIWKKISEDYSGVFIAQILVAGEIVAVNEDKMVVVLNDLGFCNRLMRYENFVKLIEIFDNYSSGIKDYICLPKGIWNKIKVDYKSKYSQENPKVTLDKIAIGVLRRKEQIGRAHV